jgi:hypothetical protein
VELRADPTLARGHFLNFVEHQTDAGFFPGHIWAGSINTNGFYHAAWGRAVLGLDRVHPDDDFLAAAYAPLVRYARYFERERDRERSGLFDVVDQYETGQEYMSRYLFVDPQADSHDWDNSLRLKGIDATVYIYDLYLALAAMAERSGRADDAAEWSRRAGATAAAVRSHMWDAGTGFFYDVDARAPGDWRRSTAKAAVGFYPLIYPAVADGAGLAGPAQLAAIDRHLLNPDEFWTTYPVPSTSANDPTFDANAEWRGKRMSCPWNGRTWPMTNSHVAEALVGAAELAPNRRALAAEFISGYIRMMFGDGDAADASEPNCFEHYHPYSGKPGRYRGIDD